MSLVIDASVALKWFFFEELHQEALALLDMRAEMMAPDLFRAEFVNVLWKKVRRSEVSAEDASLLVERVETFVTCISSDAGIANIALSYATKLDHPCYDCLYLALAEQLGTKFVTADVKFASKVAHAGLSHLIARLDQPIEKASALSISDKELDDVIALSKRYDATLDNVYHELQATSGVRWVNMQGMQPAWDSPARKRLIDALSALSDIELKELAALAWLGRGYDGRDFTALRKHADVTFADGAIQHIAYISSLLRYVESGLASLHTLPDDRER